MPTVSVADLAALAESLTKALVEAEKTSRNLAAHVATEGRRVGAALGRTYAKAAQEQIDEHAKTMGADLQRATDLIAEFRRQRAPLERAADLANRIALAVRQSHYAGEDCISVKALLDIIQTPDRPTTEEPR